MQSNLTKPRIAQFQKTVLGHFKRLGRTELPWRHTADPYAIVVSEVMLQQTQAGRVTEKYKAFLRRFPTVRKLAKAPLSEVLSAWSGLGYNRRAKFLKQMAEQVVLVHKGKFPRTAAELEALPGIGHYTARAICAFAYDMPEIFIETNIRTVFIHHFFADAEHVSDKELLPVIEASIGAHPRIWYAALMDYGSHLKQAGNMSHRKSRQYVRQGGFIGSMRQLRGAIVRSLLSGPKTKQTLIKSMEKTESAVQAAIAALLQENMIQKKGKMYALANR